MLPERIYSPTASTLPAPGLDSDVFRVASSVLPRPRLVPCVWCAGRGETESSGAMWECIACRGIGAVLS